MDSGNQSSKYLPELLLIIICFLLRIIPAILTPVTADIILYQKVAYPVLAGINPYSLKSLYPYPPVWVWFEAGALWLSYFSDIPFQILIKTPSIVSDILISLLIFKILKPQGRQKAFILAAFYTVNPVSILITGFHGQFDSMAILFLLMAVYYLSDKRKWLAPICLSLSICLKSFPVLFLPLFLLFGKKSRRDRLLFLILSLLPVAVILLPFLVADFTQVQRELFGYSGFPDYGWLAVVRGIYLTDNKPIFTPLPGIYHLLSFSKIIFLVFYGFFLFWSIKTKKFSSLYISIAIIFCLFYFFFGGISSQYLLWIVPFLTIFDFKSAVYYTFVSLLALLGFYNLFYPEMISWFFHFNLLAQDKILFNLLSAVIFWLFDGFLLIRKLLPQWR